MGSSTKVQAPQPSAEESELMRRILDQLTKQQAYNDQMLPEYAHQLHYRIEEAPAQAPDYSASQRQLLEDQAYLNQMKPGPTNFLVQSDPKFREIWERNNGGNAGQTMGSSQFNSFRSRINNLVDSMEEGRSTYAGATTQKFVKMSDEEWYNSEKTTDSERQQWDIAQETASRQLKALRGELPLTESLQQQKAKEFEQMKATYGITGDLDTAAAQDTIGTQNLSEFKKRWNALEEQERYGQLSSGTQQNIQATGLASDIANRNIGSLAGLGGQNAGITSGYYSLLQPYMAYTQAGYQAQAQNQMTQAQQRSSLYGLGGMLGAAALMAASSKKYKTGIKTKTKKDEDKALKQVLGTRSVEYKYKKGMGLGVGKHTGAIAEESGDNITNTSRTAINLADKLELVAMAVKSLDRKVQKLGAEA